jgi:hypothetical protein
VLKLFFLVSLSIVSVATLTLVRPSIFIALQTNGDRVGAAVRHKEEALVRRERQTVRIAPLKIFEIKRDSLRICDVDLLQHTVSDGVDHHYGVAVVVGDIQMRLRPVEDHLVWLAADGNATAHGGNGGPEIERDGLAISLARHVRFAVSFNRHPEWELTARDPLLGWINLAGL